jgi:polyisoprenoid-binding protein YceI
MTALKSDDTRRDSQIKAKGIETTKFPSASFELSSPITLPALPKLLDEIPTKALGRLTLHGVTKDVTLDLTARWSGDRIDIAGHTDIVMADYGIDPPSIAGIVSVQNHGVLELQLMLTR